MTDPSTATPPSNQTTASRSASRPAIANAANVGPPEIAPSSSGSRLILVLVLVLIVIVVAIFIALFGPVRHWVALHTGIVHGGPDEFYNFWSGFGSDLGEATLISAVGVGVYTGVRKVNCQYQGLLADRSSSSGWNAIHLVPTPSPPGAEWRSLP